jgi:hypothetical protein
MRKTRGEKNIRWIEMFCLVPHGPDKGQHVKLTQEQRDTLREIYDMSKTVEVGEPLAAYLALMHVCGPEALQKEFRPDVRPDIFTTWAATGPDLKAVLKRDGEHILCPELGTRYPAAA